MAPCDRAPKWVLGRRAEAGGGGAGEGPRFLPGPVLQRFVEQILAVVDVLVFYNDGFQQSKRFELKVPQTQFFLRVLDIPAVMQRQEATVQTFTLQLQFLEVVDVPLLCKDRCAFAVRTSTNATSQSSPKHRCTRRPRESHHRTLHLAGAERSARTAEELFSMFFRHREAIEVNKKKKKKTKKIKWKRMRGKIPKNKRNTQKKEKIKTRMKNEKKNKKKNMEK